MNIKTKKITILQIGTGAYSIPPNGAGAVEKIIFYLSIGLSKLNVDVKVVDIKSSLHREFQAGITIEEVNDSKFKYKNIFVYLTKLVLFSIRAVIRVNKMQSDIHIIHTHSQFPATAFILARSIFHWKYNLVHTCHNPYLLMHPTLSNKIKNILEMFVLKKCDRIIALTKNASYQMQNQFGIPANKIICIPNGVEIEEIDNYIKFQNNKLHKLSEEKIIFYPARICPRKNQLSLIMAIPEVLKKYENIKVILSGPIDDDKYYQDILHEINNRNLSQYIVFTGELNKNEIYKQYLDADLMVFPTLYEVQPLVLIESLAFGVPVIASKIPPIQDIIKNDEVLLLNDYNDYQEIAAKILKVILNYELSNILSERGKILANSFSWPNIAKKTAKLYENLITI